VVLLLVLAAMVTLLPVQQAQALYQVVVLAEMVVVALAKVMLRPLVLAVVAAGAAVAETTVALVRMVK
jgi:hypothetical protein